MSWATTSSRVGAAGPPCTRLSTQYCGWVTSILAMASRRWRVTAAWASPLQYPTGWVASASSVAAGSAGA